MGVWHLGDLPVSRLAGSRVRRRDVTVSCGSVTLIKDSTMRWVRQAEVLSVGLSSRNAQVSRGAVVAAYACIDVFRMGVFAMW